MKKEITVLRFEDEKIVFKKELYAVNSSTAVNVVAITDGYHEDYCDLSTNLTEDLPLPNEIWVRSDDTASEIANELERAGMLEDTGKRASSGFCTYRLYRITPKLIFSEND